MGQRVQIVRQIEVRDQNQKSFITTEVFHSHWGGYSSRHFLDLAIACGKVLNETSKIRYAFQKDENFFEEVVKTTKEIFCFSDIDEEQHTCGYFGDIDINDLKNAEVIANHCDCDDGIIAIKITLDLCDVSYDKDKVRVYDIDIQTAFFSARYINDRTVVEKVTSWELFHKWNMKYYENLINSGEISDEEEIRIKEELKDAKKIYKFFEAGMNLLDVKEWQEFEE